MTLDESKPRITLKAVVGQYTRSDRRFIDALRIFETDWPVAMEVVPDVFQHFFGDPLASNNPGFAALSHALAQYQKRQQVGDQQRLLIFMSTFAKAVAAQSISPTTWETDAQFTSHIESLEKKRKRELESAIRDFDVRFLTGETYVARVWRRIQKSEGLNHVRCN